MRGSRVAESIPSKACFKATIQSEETDKTDKEKENREVLSGRGHHDQLYRRRC
jgi:hypothetical protein